MDSIIEIHKEFTTKLLLKSQEKFRNDKHNVFTEKGKKIALSTNYDKRMLLLDSTQTYACKTSRDLVCRKEEINCSNIKYNTKWITLIISQEKKLKEHNPNWPIILNHPYKILIIGGCESGGKNAFLSLISHLPFLISHVNTLFSCTKKYLL